MEDPFIRIEESGAIVALCGDVTTIGRGCAVDVRLSDPSVSRLHAEIVRRGPYAYVTDLGLSRNGTRVNGRLVARRVLEDGDVLTFGSARCRVGGIAHEDFAAEVELRRSAAPELTRRELDVLTSLCRPALSDEAFVAPATAREIASISWSPRPQSSSICCGSTRSSAFPRARTGGSGWPTRSSPSASSGRCRLRSALISSPPPAACLPWQVSLAPRPRRRRPWCRRPLRPHYRRRQPRHHSAPFR